MLETLSHNNEFHMLAIDHVGSIEEKVGKENLVTFKKQVLTTLGTKASSLLIDKEYGLPAYKNAGITTPFIIKADPETGSFTPSITAKQAKEINASGIKLLIRYNHTAKDAQNLQHLVMQLGAEAVAEKLPFILEILPYESPSDLDTDFLEPSGEIADARIMRQEIIAPNVELISIVNFFKNELKAPVSIYKLPFPGSPNDCKKITEVLVGTPWVMLSGGDNFDTFLEKYKIAKANGASGFLAGRSLWQEAEEVPQETRIQYIETNILPRWEKLVGISQ